MTIVAGIIGRGSAGSVPEQARSALRRLISRDAGDVIHECSGTDWIMLKVDIGAFGSSGVCDDADHVTSMLAGEPLLADGTAHKPRTRTEDLKTLQAAIDNGDWSVFAKSTGTYCGAHYDRAARRLTLFTDKLGLRPIYYWSNARFIVYASALRILEGLAEVPKCLDLRGVTEVACFGFPLADRTAYDNIKTLLAGEILRCSPEAVESVEYWRWDRLTPPHLSGMELAQEAHRRFMSAVERRVGNSRSEVAFLSGGLDSRTIVAALRGLDVSVQSINFAPRDTQDEVFARQAAATLGTTHHYLIKDAEAVTDKGQTYNQSLVSAWFDAQPVDASGLARRRVVWSGDGGSVAVGHVYLNPKAVELAQGGAAEEAIDEFCRYNTLQLSTKIFNPDVAELVATTPKRGIRDELSRLDCSDRGRALHLFLMLNDQRRHMFDFYENIDLGRLEFQLPFFDSSFLELILASPVAAFLGHRFYMDWLKTFPPGITDVPWQAYRGHVPCPLPVPTELRYQWANYYDRATQRQMKLAILDQAASVFSSVTFPDKIIDKLRLRLASWSTRLGIRDYSHVVRTAAVYGRYWRVCQSTVTPDGASQRD